jgi:hypothetical protein
MVVATVGDDSHVIFIAIAVAVPFCVGILVTIFCLYLCRWRSSRAQDAVILPGALIETSSEVVEGAHEVATMPVRRPAATGGLAPSTLAYGSEDAVHQVLMGLPQVQLKEMCAAHRLLVGGNKTVLVDRLIAADVAPLEQQCRGLLQLAARMVTLGHRRSTFCLADVVTRGATTETMRKLALVCRPRSGS